MTDDLPATITPKPVKERRVSKLVRQACDLLASGQAKSIKHASELLGCSREHLSRQFGKEHVQGYLARRAGRKISLAILRAAQVKVDLLDANSERVRDIAATDILAMGGLTVPRADGPQVSINVGIRAGYVIDLSDGPEHPMRIVSPTPPTPAPAIEHEPDDTEK